MKKIVDLFERRMSTDGDNRVNSLKGLYDLIKMYVKPHFIIVEIGSFEGVSTELFALNFAQIISVDPYDEKEESSFKYNKLLPEAEKKFMDRMFGYSNLRKIRKPSVIAAQEIEDASIDMVYIDGDHRYDSVIKDIKAWLRKVRIGGYIAGHDYFDVRKAIEDTLGVVNMVFEDTSWLWYNNGSIVYE